MTPWNRINHRLIAKAISELHFEEVLAPLSLGEDRYRLDLQSGVCYRFKAKLSAWGHLWVNAETISRMRHGQVDTEIEASQFFIDSLNETQMSELTLGTFLEEMNNTLLNDLTLIQKKKYSAKEMSTWDGEKVQQVLEGHTKLLLNKGRMGWGHEDHKLYAPESENKFQLRWILAHKNSLRGAGAWNPEESFQGNEKEKIQQTLLDHPEHILMPVHPWQWDRVIKLQFQSEIQNKNIIDLGFIGDFYSPQTSLRTLFNCDRPEKCDIKLPLSILNTSCVRGLPQKYLPVTPQLSKVLSDLCQSDVVLRKTQTLEEIAAWGYEHPYFHQVSGASYRYHEFLGAVWRQSLAGKLAIDEKAVLAAALFHQDEAGQTLLSAYAAEAQVSIEEWLKAYTKEIIIPLYHLQTAYGIGLVAHGQNVVVRLKKGLPSGLFLKDFHGDLRLSTKALNEHQKRFLSLVDTLTHLPPEHLIHDLITGHFVTVLRFMAHALAESNEISEQDFYHIIGNEIYHYQKQYSSLIRPEINLLSPRFQRVLVNKVRFKIGYGDSSERPLPILGSELNNPLYREDYEN